MRGPAIEGRGTARSRFADDMTSDFGYDIARADLAQLQWLTGQTAAGTVATKGRLTGPWTALHAAGDASITQLDAFDVNALTISGQYDVTVPSGDAARAHARA